MQPTNAGGYSQQPQQIPQMPMGYNQPQYQSVPVTSDEIYANQMQEERIKNIFAQIAPENQLNEIEMRLKGFKRNFQTGGWDKISESIKEPSPLLINNYISYLSSIVNQNTTMGNLSSTQINLMMAQIIQFVTDDLDSNAELYGIQGNYSEMSRIGHIMLNTTFLVLGRSLNGSEARRFWGSLSLMESSNPNPNQQQKSDWWKVWKK